MEVKRGKQLIFSTNKGFVPENQNSGILHDMYAYDLILGGVFISEQM